MKLFVVCLCALSTLALANVVEIKNTAEDEDAVRLETGEIASEDEQAIETASEDEDAVMEKRLFFRRRRCQTGAVESKYCTNAAKDCFRSGQNVPVRFKPAFRRKPRVTLGFTLIDTNKDQNVRVRVSAVSVTRFGFQVKFTPWDRSITYQLGVSWMACP